jgi:hypothetical protein
MLDDEQPYKVLSPTKVRLSQTAREWAREFGLSDAEMAVFLLQQDRQRKQGQP